MPAVMNTLVRSGVRPRSVEWEPVAVIVAWTIVAVVSGLALASVVVSIPLRLPINYNEGWNAYHVSRLLRGGALYPTVPFFENNYPPLSFYLVGWCSRWTGDPIVAGRWLSLIAFAVWTGLIVATGRRLGAREGDAWIAAALFGVTMLLFTEYVGIADPELIGHAIQAAAVLLLVHRPAGAPRLAAAALLCVVALAVKQTLIVVPIAAILWLATVDRRSAGLFGAMCAALVAAGLLLCDARFGRSMIGDLVAPRAYIPLRALGKTALWAWRLAVPAIVAVLVFRRWRADARVRLCAVYAGTAAVVGCLASGGDGINANVFFDAIAALSLVTAIALTRLSASHEQPRQMRARLLLALAVMPLIGAAVPSTRAWLPANGWFGARGDRVSAAADIAFIAAHDGAALCEELALCFWAGKPAQIDVFHVRQQMLTGTHAAADVARLVSAQTFAVIELDIGGRQLDEGFARALESRYAMARVSSGRRLYVPR